MATIGKSIVFKGELSGEESLEIEGTVDGHIQLPNHQLTIGQSGRVTAEIEAKMIVVIGSVFGNIVATERLEIRKTAVVEGDIRAPRLLIEEGATVNGSISMSPPGEEKPAVLKSTEELARQTG